MPSDSFLAGARDGIEKTAGPMSWLGQKMVNIGTRLTRPAAVVERAGMLPVVPSAVPAASQAVAKPEGWGLGKKLLLGAGLVGGGAVVGGAMAAGKQRAMHGNVYDQVPPPGY